MTPGSVRRVRVRVLPWRPRLREVDGFDFPDFLDFGDDLGIALGIGLFLVVLLLVAPIAFALALFVGELALVLLLAPLLVVVQLLGLRPWYLRVTPVEGEPTWVCAGTTREMLAARRFYRSLRP